MNARNETLLWVAQRASAAVLALCVIVHLVNIIRAVRVGLSAAEILGRTHGSYAWFAFYALFVAAASIHAPIGLRTIVAETCGWRGAAVDGLTLVAGIALALWGWRAVFAVFA